MTIVSPRNDLRAGDHVACSRVSGSIINLLTRSGGSNACEIESTTAGCRDRAMALESALMSAFGNGRKRIRSVCAKVINQNGGKGVVLHSGLFRVDGMEPDRGTMA
ncbi:hypothetical protein [Paraburkholderia sp. BR14320]|uniref:hypothetical protein n=2 Tax=Paraburkholderia TaxID=1822464 RepID=UPI0034CF7A0C